MNPLTGPVHVMPEVASPSHWWNTAAPWWATILAPIATLIITLIASHYANRQKTRSENTDRANERDHNRQIEMDRLKAELEKANAELRGRAEEKMRQEVRRLYGETSEALGRARTAIIANAATYSVALLEPIDDFATKAQNMSLFVPDLGEALSNALSRLDELIREPALSHEESIAALDSYAEDLRSEVREVLGLD